MAYQRNVLRRATAVLALACVGALQGVEYHVSPRGNDAGVGSLQQPFLSLDKARLAAQAAREERPEDAVVIYVHPGVHMLTSTVTFKEGDAGTPERPLRIEGWADPERPGAWPVMIGGVVVTGWQHTTFNGRDDVWVADLASLGTKDKFRNLFLNGRRQFWARYPNYDVRYPYSGGWKAVIADHTARIPNAAFAAAAADALAADANLCAAAGWRWYRKALPDAQTEVVATAGGKNALRMHAAYNPERKYIKNACVRSDFFSLAPGRSYRLSFTLQAGDEDCTLMSRVVTETHSADQRQALQKMLAPQPDEKVINEPPAPFWKAFGQKSFSVAKGRSLQCDAVFYLPQPGDKDYDERMGDLAVHFQFLNQRGWVDIIDLALAEVEEIDEWGSWQAAGADRHSEIADPLFVDAAAGDYRLRPESPALRLGFEPIPFEKIGPYADPARATWPIVEAEGVRENPQWLEEPPQS